VVEILLESLEAIVTVKLVIQEENDGGINFKKDF
jgi:hypothetical protein